MSSYVSTSSTRTGIQNTNLSAVCTEPIEVSERKKRNSHDDNSSYNRTDWPCSFNLWNQGRTQHTRK